MSVLLAVAGCATLDGGEAFDDRFDADWMVVVPVDRGTLPGYCQREDRPSLLGCARPHQDASGGAVAVSSGGGDGGGGGVAAAEAGKPGTRGTCVIYVARDLMRDSTNFDQVLRHEAKHCRGWRHPGD